MQGRSHGLRACVALGLPMVLTVIVSGCSSQVPAPTSYTAFTSKDGAFRIQYPEGWKAESGSRPDNTYSWARFTQGPAAVRVIADVSGSLMADVSRAFGGDDDDEFPPVLAAHESKTRIIADDFGDYHEGKSILIDTAMGKSCVCEFEANGSMGVRLRGYRVTMLSRDRRITVLTYCPLKQWNRLKPAFEEVFLSVGRG
ncbi:hypothetical protein BH23PLA1_BH23PLA1_34380 [soil metagenome]